MSITIYHNPRCSKSRQTLRLLEQHGVTPTIVEYLTDVPSAADIERLVALLGVDVRDVIRADESTYTDLQLHDPNLGRTELVQAIADNPILLQRPIVVSGDRAIIGRPPDNVLSLL
jgi:arsenate reductase